MEEIDALQKLENRFDALLAALAALKQENDRLRETAAGTRVLEAEVQALKVELERERTARRAVLERIDLLLKKVKLETAEP